MGRIMRGDCRKKLRQLKENSVDAVVTDPPYELNFMGKGWDNAGVAFNVKTWRAAYRVLKPGGFLLAFGGTRTFHRMVCAIEDAGFEIRDCMSWNYGSGFPKSMDVSKAIDKMKGAKRKVVGTRIVRGVESGHTHKGGGGSLMGRKITDKVSDVTLAATDAARQWSGWGTALKPAWEPIIVARKPLSEKTVAANVLKWGTGALNIDASRIGYASDSDKASATPQGKVTSGTSERIGAKPSVESKGRQEFERPEQKGRWPANVILSHDELCRVVGEQHVNGKAGGSGKGSKKSKFAQVRSSKGNGGNPPGVGGTTKLYACVPDCPVRILDGQSGFQKDGVAVQRNGGASRFFYVAKAAGKEKTHSGKVKNNHPTVKPVKLMRYLIRLVTPHNGVVLDPFAGSGTTAVAAIKEGFDFIMVEKSREYKKILKQRIREAREA